MAPSWRRLARAAADPSAAQAARLNVILRANEASAFGRAHGFAKLYDSKAFARAVPVHTYDELWPWIERVAAGETGVLTREPVLMFERTSGSTAPNKLIPYTRGLLREIAAAVNPWLYNLNRALPPLRRTRAYWSISPVTRQAERTAGGVPVGLEDDASYFGALGRWFVARQMVVPSSVGRLPDIEAWRFATCRHLLAAPDLGLISVWSPSFLTLLLDAIARDWTRLLPLSGRARVLGPAVERAGQITGEILWPELALVSCWADGPAAAFLPALRRYFPRTPIQAKGLLASEGVVSFPLWGLDGGLAAVASHFLEFIDLEQPNAPPRLAHELRAGAAYAPLLTTSGGLYRYHLRDVVRCVGHWQATPLLSFLGRLDTVSDLAGEKLDARVVGEALSATTRALGAAWQFAMLAPESGPPPAYVVYLEGEGSDALLAETAAHLEAALAAGAHYAYCRKLGQLGPLRAVRVRDGAAAVARRGAAEGLRLGDIKPSPLDRRVNWQPWFS